MMGPDSSASHEHIYTYFISLPEYLWSVIISDNYLFLPIEERKRIFGSLRDIESSPHY